MHKAGLDDLVLLFDERPMKIFDVDYEFADDGTDALASEINRWLVLGK